MTWSAILNKTLFSLKMGMTPPCVRVTYDGHHGAGTEARSQKQEARSSPTGAARSLLASDGRQLALLASCF
jgi:hypothetical protein